MLSVLINTYNRPETLGRCLAALAGQPAADRARCEVIIVDDGGTAPLAPVLEPFRGDRAPLRVRLERIDHAGRATARNRALALAAGERVLFMGDDVIAGEGLLGWHLVEPDPAVAVVGPYPLAGLTGSPPFRRWAEPNPQHMIVDPRDAGPFFFATGNLSAGRQLLMDLGGFDTRFRRYGWEDIDLGLRLKRAGGRVRFDWRAAAAHAHPTFGCRELWERERQVGYTAWQFAEKWAEREPALVAKVRFWGDPARLSPPSPLRRRIGEALLALLDRRAPASALNARLYERMVFTYRLEGVREAWLDAQAGALPKRTNDE